MMPTTHIDPAQRASASTGPQPLWSYERVALCAPVRDLLCDLAAVDAVRPLRTAGVDWDEALTAICAHGLIGVAEWYLRSQAPGNVPVWFYGAVRARYRQAALHLVRLMVQFDAVLEQLEAAGLEYLVIKGPVAASLYPEPTTRLYGDLDLVVRERDWVRAHALLTALGFAQEEGLPTPPPKLIPACCPYETKYWHPQSGALIEVHYDDVLHAGLAARDADGFWQRAVGVLIAGRRVPTLAPDDHLLLLALHAHYHGYTRLSWLSDMALLIRRYGQTLDWPRLVATARREEAQVGLYYSLLVLRAQLGVAAPQWVFAALRPDMLRRVLHACYLPLGQVLALQPMWRPDFSFYHRPLYKRLLPDLLVMGRRREKLRYLARLACPPRAWLRHYYGLGEAQPLLPHYLLHPIKLLVHAAAETLGLMRGAKDDDHEC